MIKKMCALTATMMLAAVPAMAEEAPGYNCDFSPACEVAPGIYGAMSSPVKSKFNLSIGGYLKLDYAHNTNAVGPVSPGAPGGGLKQPAGGYKDESIFTAKQSRFWLKVAGPTFLGAKTNAMIEADFFGTGSLSNEFGNMRMRHAYATMDWTNTQVLFGQFWDTFGPAAADTLDFRQGGTTGLPSSPRVPQIRLTQKLNLNKDNTLKFVLAVQNPVQDNPTQGSVTTPVVDSTGAAVLDKNGKPLTVTTTGVPPFYTSGGSNSMSTTSGAYGSLVNAAGQIMFSSKVLGVSPGFMGLGMSPLQVGVFGLVGSQKFKDNHAVDVYGYGVYGFVPLMKSKDGKNRAMTLSLETQAYMAAGMDVQGATAAATLNAAPNKTAAKGFGMFGQVKFYPTQDMGITGGYMRRNAYNYGNYTGTFEKYNDSLYANITYDLNAAVRVATEYAHNTTQWSAVPSGSISSFAQNNIFRLSAYYFF